MNSSQDKRVRARQESAVTRYDRSSVEPTKHGLYFSYDIFRERGASRNSETLDQLKSS